MTFTAAARTTAPAEPALFLCPWTLCLLPSFAEAVCKHGGWHGRNRGKSGATGQVGGAPGSTVASQPRTDTPERKTPAASLIDVAVSRLEYHRLRAFRAWRGRIGTLCRSRGCRGRYTICLA